LAGAGAGACFGKTIEFSQGVQDTAPPDSMEGWSTAFETEALKSSLANSEILSGFRTC
jgi:hypothetical protein